MLDHKQLVKKAAYWLKSAKQCNPVFAEQGSANFSEMPDAIGWTARECIVVECKTSRSDLLADMKKEHRNIGGLGTKRYYLMPRELYEQCKDIELNGWGIILCDEYGITQKARFIDSKDFASNKENEVYFLRSRILEIQRFGL